MTAVAYLTLLSASVCGAFNPLGSLALRPAYVHRHYRPPQLLHASGRSQCTGLHMLAAASPSAFLHNPRAASRQAWPGPRMGTPWGEKVLSWQVLGAGVVCWACLWQLSLVSATRLLTLHVAFMAPIIPLGTSAVSTVRQRKRAPKIKLADARARKRRAEWLIIRHFVASASALYLAAAGMAAIWLQKRSLGRRHLTTPHSWAGAAAFALWLATYLSAQPQVWRDQWRQRRKLVSHRRPQLPLAAMHPYHFLTALPRRGQASLSSTINVGCGPIHCTAGSAPPRSQPLSPPSPLACSGGML